MTMKELAEQLTPGRWTEADGLITIGNGVLVDMDEAVFEVGAIVGDEQRTADGRVWRVEDSAGVSIVTETRNGDVVIETKGWHEA